MHVVVTASSDLSGSRHSRRRMRGVFALSPLSRFDRGRVRNLVRVYATGGGTGGERRLESDADHERARATINHSFALCSGKAYLCVEQNMRKC